MLLFVFLQFLSGPVSSQNLSLLASWVLCLLHCNLCLYLLFQCLLCCNLYLKCSIPNNNCPFPGTIKKLHILHLLLFSNVTPLMPNCVIVDWLYVLSLVSVSFVAVNCSTVALGNNFFVHVKWHYISIAAYDNLISHCNCGFIWWYF